MTQPAGCGWEALSGDPLPWLLDEQRPNLLWRVLVELVGRPADSTAVARARGGANAAEPVASLLAELHPDGSWASDRPLWSRYAGPGWRLVAAVAWGADPGDPRLHVAGERMLASAPGDGGFAPRAGAPPALLLTARLVQAAIELGFGRHLRVQEALAWMEETPGAWSSDRRQRTVAGAVLSAALAIRPELGRQPLRDRAAAGRARCSRRWRSRPRPPGTPQPGAHGPRRAAVGPGAGRGALRAPAGGAGRADAAPAGRGRALAPPLATAAFAADPDRVPQPGGRGLPLGDPPRRGCDQRLRCCRLPAAAVSAAADPVAAAGLPTAAW